jgi:hypothetical protein
MGWPAEVGEPPAWQGPVESAALLGSVVALVLCVASVFGRLRRAAGVERQQLKWLTLGMVAGLPATTWSGLLTIISSVTFVACIGVAMLRFHLYDIDRVISRVLAYALVTAVLVGVYAALVVGLGAVIGRSGSPLLIAGGTLVVAALFGPVRRRVQAGVDRRFNRRRYDAQRALEAFSAGLRDGVALEQVRGHLLATVRETMQPAQASVWLRGGAR